MTDLISRADAIAYIDRVIKSGLGRYKSLNYIRKYISALPSADAVQRGWCHRIRPSNVEVVVRCKDCRWYDNGYGDVCHNPRYGDGHANYPPPYVDEDYWCKDGERKGGDTE